jgi:RHS repeat-associated protein
VSATTRCRGGGVAYRTGAGTAYGFEITDQHGTAVLTLDNTAQTPTWRQLTPYGQSRGTAVTWIDNRGFLDKPTDTNTGLSIIGARQYDPTAGRFISLDPILEATSSQQLGGYTYAADNPITHADPSGLCPSPDCAGARQGPPAPKPGHPNPGIPCGTPGGAACWSPPDNGNAASGPSTTQVSPHVYVSTGDPRLAVLQAAWRWETAHYGPVHRAEAEFSAWWRACTISLQHSACTGQFGANFAGINLNIPSRERSAEASRSYWQAAHR